MNEVTRIINAIQQGDGHASEELLPLVYEELRLLAAQKMGQEKPGQTLQATALVHEAYIRLLDGSDQDWNSRGHFFMAAAEAMRRILVENARRKKSLKRGGDRQRVELDDAIVVFTQEISPEDILVLDEAMDKLSEEDNIAAELIKLRLFGGLTVKQAAKVLQISLSKAYSDIEYAHAWLRLAVGGSDITSDL